ncbi:glycosyltransferase family 9 protein [Desulfovibrio desulfuricans]|uniref:Glycosyltransferase family 9 protein n=1 Tax=Desulfovibrio desulfuricans TaxID=876 RepID=A0A4P7ULC9_DESDE|nr:glycosyltransferase family 9 protein [Desulfovibrio desulfuricans]QCC85714.1 glycosyltransferase family 9 protein [Desulfovibrio desulfuricans]
MAADPVLVLQLHRMGDLILTFPLLMRLRQLWPDNPLWVVAEPVFFQQLMPLAPGVVFFPPSHCGTLAQQSYAAAINLSSSPLAAQTMAALRSPVKLGPMDDGAGLHIKGYWQLYRAALTQNNHANAFHWADLHLLDLSPRPDIAAVGHSRPAPAGTRRVGLVLGASEAAKRPDAGFWARLAARLASADLTPVFLGGKSEEELGAEVARRCGLGQANLCGKLSLSEVAALMRTLDLCITPDTGPMHLADYLGVPVLNLSMGPVHARETGPCAPGQWVLRAAMSCVGCWQCSRGRLYCKQAFMPAPVARIITDIHSGLTKANAAAPAACAGLALYRTGRDTLGLHTLARTDEAPQASCRPLLEDVWQAVFLFMYDPALEPLLRQRLARLQAGHPQLASRLAARFARLFAQCGERFKQRGVLSDDFWRGQPGMMRLFTGHLHMFLQNEGFGEQGWRTALQRLAALTPLFATPA